MGRNREGETQMETIRRVDTPHGPITYRLARKKIRRLNLRVGLDGQVRLSVPWRIPAEEADGFVREKSGWITAHLAPPQPRQTLPPVQPEECRRCLEESVDRVYPLVARAGVARPAVKLRAMTSLWGSCHRGKGYITLNTALARCPQTLRDYVALHELVHFLHPNHGPGFYAAMDARMPDWKERRRALQEYGRLLLADGQPPQPGQPEQPAGGGGA